MDVLITLQRSLAGLLERMHKQGWTKPELEASKLIDELPHLSDHPTRQVERELRGLQS